jgi:hypothetical protein
MLKISACQSDKARDSRGLILNLGQGNVGTSGRDRTIGAMLAPHAQYAAMFDMHGFSGRSRSFRF